MRGIEYTLTMRDRLRDARYSSQSTLAASTSLAALVVSAATTSAARTKQTFACVGLQSIFVWDNGSCFCSEEFDSVVELPVSNTSSLRLSIQSAMDGLAERAVHTLTYRLKKTRGNLEDCLYTFQAR